VTVAFWNFVATADIQQANAFSVGNQDNPNRFQSHAPYNDHFLHWDYGDWTGNGRVSINYDPYLDRWTHVVLVSEGNGGTFKGIYLDGVLVASGTVSDGPDVPLNGLTLGLWAMFNNRHKGKIDDFRIYSRVLTPSQVQLLSGGNTEPGAPTLSAVAAAGHVQLDWTIVAGAASYKVQRSPTPGGPHVPIATVSGSGPYLDSSPTPGLTYYYVVTALGVSEGPASNEVAVVARSAGAASDLVVGGCGAVGLDALLLLGILGQLARRFRSSSGGLDRKYLYSARD
jgi:hypothetical protein